MTRTTLVAALAAAAFVLPAPAAAQSARPVAQQSVAHGDLDLSRADDIRRLDLRLTRAARKVCGPALSIDLPGARSAKRCTGAALDNIAEARARAIGAARVQVAQAR